MLIQNEKEFHYPYFCLILNNFTRIKHHLNLKKLKLNNESYQVIIQMEPNFLKMNPANKDSWLDCKNNVYKIFKKNWLDITENKFTQPIDEFETLIFPMKLLKAASHWIIAIKKESLLFFPKNKISISLGINGKTYEYGIKRRMVYERYINYLAFIQDYER